MALLLRALAAPAQQAPAAQDFSHRSEALGETRAYRVYLPPAYAESGKRYPVVYWFHGEGERYDAAGDDIAAYVAGHELIVVRPDGANPQPANRKGRAWNIGDETGRQFALYFPELVDQIDGAFRTVAGREGRAVGGAGSGGFMAYWIAGKFPDLAGSASAIDIVQEALAGPRGFATEYRHEDLSGNYEGVRTLLISARKDAVGFYNRRLNAVWQNTRGHHEAAAEGGISQALDFHMRAFAEPLAKPAVFGHADVFPDFSVWGWEVVSNRRRPGFTVLENVSKTGFRCSVREWVPSGATIPEAKLTVTSPPIFPRGGAQVVTYVRLRDGNTRRATQKAAADGRLSFELDGEAYEVGISKGPELALTGADLVGEGWAVTGQTAALRVRFLNKGGAQSATAPLRWESPNPGVVFAPAEARLFALGPGESAVLPVTVTAANPEQTVVRIVAVVGEARLPIDVPVFPPAEEAKDFLISDGHTADVFRRAVEKEETTLGEGNSDGHAAPGESFAILFPEGPGGVMRAAELFTSDPCVDNSVRLSDWWEGYDRAGASMKFSVATIRADCEPGRVVRMLARIVVPGAPEHRVVYRVVQFPVWYRIPAK